MSDETQAITGEVVKRTVKYNGGTLTPFTHANAREMQAKSVEARRNKAMRSARQRTVARLAATDPTIQTPSDAWGELVADQAEALRQAASEGKPRGDDLIRVGQALGAIPLPHERERVAATGGATLHVSAAVVDAIVARLIAGKARQADSDGDETG